MLEVRFCIEARKNYPLRKVNDDDWIAEINSLETKKECFFVVPEGFLFTLHNKQREELETRYNIAGVFDLGAPYTNTGVHMTLVHVVSCPVDSLNVAIFNGVTYDRKKNKPSKEQGIETPDQYLPKFNTYIQELENWINKGVTPDHDPEGQYEYNSIPIVEVDFKKRYPKYYSRQALEVRELLEKEDTIKLSDVADIVIPKEDKKSTEDVKRLKMKDFRYPLRSEDIDYGKPTTVILQRGDMIFPLMGDAKPYLFNGETKEQVYASPNTAVIKCHNISPEYLYLFLISDTAVCILDSMTLGVAIKHIKVSDLVNLPIPKPTQDDEKYRVDFEILTGVGIRQYGTFTEDQNYKMKQYAEILEKISKHEQKAEVIEDILNVEMASKIKVHNEEQLRSFLSEDLRELNTCFRGKAYKATLILAGSILEAVLIDWLSEINHKDYFKEDYMVIDQRTGRQKRADLIDYINEIKEIERPYWMDEANKAHVIRRKRNLVHAKLCMKSDEVNETVCREVIEYLKDVLKTRGVK